MNEQKIGYQTTASIYEYLLVTSPPGKMPEWLVEYENNLTFAIAFGTHDTVHLC